MELRKERVGFKWNKNDWIINTIILIYISSTCIILWDFRSRNSRDTYTHTYTRINTRANYVDIQALGTTSSKKNGSLLRSRERLDALKSVRWPPAMQKRNRFLRVSRRRRSLTPVRDDRTTRLHRKTVWIQVRPTHEYLYPVRSDWFSLGLE